MKRPKPLLRSPHHITSNPNLPPSDEDEDDEADLCAGSCCLHPENPTSPSSSTCGSGSTVITVPGRRSPAVSNMSSSPLRGSTHMLDGMSPSRTSTPLKVILCNGRHAPKASFEVIDDEPESEYMDICRPSSNGSDSDSSLATTSNGSFAKPLGTTHNSHKTINYHHPQNISSQRFPSNIVVLLWIFLNDVLDLFFYHYFNYCNINWSCSIKL